MTVVQDRIGVVSDRSHGSYQDRCILRSSGPLPISSPPLSQVTLGGEKAFDVAVGIRSVQVDAADGAGRFRRPH
jgi:hypothetical protein